MPVWRSVKTYGHERGLSCTFRQHRADSHCSFVHGYALAFKFTFEGQLDERGWVMDFGGLKQLEAWLRDTFDHTTLVSKDDPERMCFEHLADRGLIDLRIVDGVGAERFAELAGEWVTGWLAANEPRVRCVEVEAREHGANAAIWMNP